jgi:CHAD domain-containing protein
MTSEGFAEIERKFDVNPTTPLPPLHDLPGVTHVGPPVEHHLDALYFDTADLTLAGRRITLRRRTGGDDPGWHLKLPVAVDERQEMREPVGEDPDVIPEEILDLVRVYLRGRPLLPVVRLRTLRVVHPLVGRDDTVLAEVCDDSVKSERFGAEPLNQDWREWEIELVDGSRALLDAAQERLSSVGVEPAASPSKLAHALGDRAPDLPAEPAKAGPGSAAGDVLLAYLRAQVDVVTAEDPLVREGNEEAVHRMRVANRRLRSALTTYAALLDAGVTEPLRVELRWIAGVLGGARDAQVMRRRLTHRLDLEPPGLAAGAVAPRIDEHFSTVVRISEADTRSALDSDRYFRLLDALDELVASPPLYRTADKAARKVIPGLVGAEWKHLRAAVHAARRTAVGTERDAALHEVRKRAKQLRYAAETAAPLRRKRAVRLVAAARQMQEILGDHQDSVVARGELLRLGMKAFLFNENSFTYGRMHAVEEAGASGTEARFVKAWRDFPSASIDE